MRTTKVDPGEIYGYAVCLVSVLVLLFAASELTESVLDLREPPYSESYREGPTLVSLEAYRLDVVGRAGLAEPSAAGATPAVPDSTVRRMYEAERLYRLALSHQVNRRRLMRSAVLMTLALFLFGVHAGWLWRRQGGRMA